MEAARPTHSGSACRCRVYMPNDVAIEKSNEIAVLGAEVHMVPPVSIAHPGALQYSLSGHQALRCKHTAAHSDMCDGDSHTYINGGHVV